MMVELLAAGINAIPSVFNWLMVLALFVFLPAYFFRRTRPAATICFLFTGVGMSLMLWISLFVATAIEWGWLKATLVFLFTAGTSALFAGAYFTLVAEGWNGLIGLAIFLIATLVCIGLGLRRKP